MATADVTKAMDEARALGLFKPHGAFEVHCSNCHARLDTRGDCANCGLIGRPESEIERRAQADPAGTGKLLEQQVAKRRTYKPVRA